MAKLKAKIKKWVVRRLKMILKKLEKESAPKEKDKTLSKEQQIERRLTAEAINESNLDAHIIEEKILKAKSFNVPIKKFLDFKGWLLEDEELWELGMALEDRSCKLHNLFQWRINTVSARTGWDRFTVWKSMNKAREEYGYAPSMYLIKQLFYIPEEQWEVYKKKEKSKKPSLKMNKNDGFIQKVMEETGWNEAQYKLAFLKAQNACGCSTYEYYCFKLYKMSPEEQKTYITSEKQWMLLRRRSDYTRFFMYLDDKVLFAEKFKEFIHRKSFSNENLTYQMFKEKIVGLEGIFVKPLNGLGGKGACTYRVNESEESNKAVYDEIIQSPAIIEEVISQNEVMSSINSSSINTVRVFTMNINGKIEIIPPAFRIGNGGIVDNFSANGMVAAVDKKTGKVITHAQDGYGNIFTEHPISHIPIMGFQIPCWDKIMEASIEAAKVLPEVEFIGWDFCVNKRGEVDLVEGNHNPGVRLPQVGYSTINQGIMHTIEKYLA